MILMGLAESFVLLLKSLCFLLQFLHLSVLRLAFCLYFLYDAIESIPLVSDLRQLSESFLVFRMLLL